MALNQKPCRLDFLPESRSDGWKLAGCEVAGSAFNEFTRSDRTMDSAIPLARNHFGSANPGRCAGLISGIAPRRFPGARLSQPQRMISPTAFDKFYPVMSGEGAAGEDTRAPFFALKNPCPTVSIRD